MKTIGLLGGMSWESTAHYYRLLNEGVRKKRGALHSAKITMVSIDFAPLARAMNKGQWQDCADILSTAAKNIQKGGADCLLICTNTMHKLAKEVQAAVSIPLLHIGDAAGRRLQNDGIDRVGLLGTRFTMEEDFYKDPLQKRYGLSVVVPGDSGRKAVDRVIFEELCRGQIKEDSREAYIRIIEELEQKGAQAILAGCTEITMLVRQEHMDTPLYDTTILHVNEALDFAFAE